MNKILSKTIAFPRSWFHFVFVIVVIFLGISAFMTVKLKKDIIKEREKQTAFKIQVDVLSNGLINVWSAPALKIHQFANNYKIFRVGSDFFLPVGDSVLKGKVCVFLSLRQCSECIDDILVELESYYTQQSGGVLILAEEPEAFDVAKILSMRKSTIPIVSFIHAPSEIFKNDSLGVPIGLFVDNFFNILHPMIIDKQQVALLKRYLQYRRG